ncbi:MAG: alpha/beta hydrolase [Thermoanaerobaculia bacterium]
MRIAVPGAELSCSVLGQGPTCLVLSSLGNEFYRRQFLPPIPDRLKLVFVDLRGTGESSGECSDLDFDRLAEDLEAVRRGIGAERVAVLGHSILGLLAIEAGRRLTSISHIIAVGTPPSGDMAALSVKANAFFAEDASPERKARLAENFARLGPAPTLREGLLAQTPMRFFDWSFDAAPLFEGAVASEKLMSHLFGKLAPGWDVRTTAAQQRAPLFLAHGRYDYAVPSTLWEGIAEALPRTTRHLFEKSGHQPFFEEPEAFAEAVLGWMAQEG